jgi:hypothetical protein
MKTRQLLGAVALVMGMLATLTGPSSAAGSIDPTTLARGPAPHVAYLSGLTIHTASGRRIAVPVPARQSGFLELMGHTSKGWVVVDHAGLPQRVLAVSHGRAPTILTWGQGEPQDTMFALSRDRTRILQDVDGQGAYTDLYVYDLSGNRVGHRYFDDVGTVRDFSGPDLIFSGRNTTLWRIGGTKTVIDASGATLADFRHDVLFVHTHGVPGHGPTTLAAPATPSWTSDGLAVAVSPNGARVLLMTGTGYAVRSMGSGKLVASWTLAHVWSGLVRWEDSTSVLLGVNGDRGQAVVRCRLGGSCRRATPWSARRKDIQVPISSPDRYPMFAYY